MNRKSSAVHFRDWYKDMIDRFDAQSKEREENFNKWVERTDTEKKEADARLERERRETEARLEKERIASEARLERERLAAEERQKEAEARLERERLAAEERQKETEARLERERREFRTYRRWQIANTIGLFAVFAAIAGLVFLMVNGNLAAY